MPAATYIAPPTLFSTLVSDSDTITSERGQTESSGTPHSLTITPSSTTKFDKHIFQCKTAFIIQYTKVMQMVHFKSIPISDFCKDRKVESNISSSNCVFNCKFSHKKNVNMHNKRVAKFVPGDE
ncbi:hypothetical protein ACFX15_030206 [Malus domestica]